MQRVLYSFSCVLIPVAAAGLLTCVHPADAQQKEPQYKPFRIEDPKLPPPAAEQPANLPGDPVLRPFSYEGPETPKYLPFSRTDWPDPKAHNFEWKSPSVGEDKGLPIDLPSALRLVNARSLDIAIAVQQVESARALHDFAKYVWLPTIQMGPQYFRHNGIIENPQAQVFNQTSSAVNVGAGINAIFTPSDAIFASLAARQVVRSTSADLTTTINDTTLAVATAYFNAQQARGELFGAQDSARQAEILVKLTEKLVGEKGFGGLVLPVEVSRARAERARRMQSVESARENWRVASAELMRILRMDPSALLDPVEAPHLQVSLVSLDRPVDSLIPVGLRNRPELASQQALVEAALLRLKAEKIRPLVPSVVLSGEGPGGSSVSFFSGGQDAPSSGYNARADVGVGVVWTLQGLGLQNIALTRQRAADQRAAQLSLLRQQDRVAAEVVQAYAKAQAAEIKVKQSEAGLMDALDSLDKNFQGVRQTRRLGEFLILVVRPQEVVAALQSLALAYTDYYDNVGDYNRAQFLLFRALGYPTQIVGNDTVPPGGSPGRGIHHRD